MSKVKNAIMDLELSRANMNYRREELADFLAQNKYTRGGTFPKQISAIKKALAESIIRVHLLLRVLDVCKFPPRDIKVSRRVTVRFAETGTFLV